MILAQSNCPDEACARKIGHILVERQLAACVSITPLITSIYRWDGKITDDSEFQLLIKSDSSLLSELERAVLTLHPYETPEFVVSSVVHVSRDYEEWLHQSLGMASK